MELILKAISSSGEPYDVQCKFTDNKLFVFCNCPAGLYGKLCKHKSKLLEGDQSLLFNKFDISKLQQVNNMIKNSNYPEIIASYNKLKKEIEQAQQKEKKLRKHIETTLTNGIEIFDQNVT